jgi:hypothetical protein
VFGFVAETQNIGNIFGKCSVIVEIWGVLFTVVVGAVFGIFILIKNKIAPFC